MQKKIKKLFISSALLAVSINAFNSVGEASKRALNPQNTPKNISTQINSAMNLPNTNFGAFPREVSDCHSDCYVCHSDCHGDCHNDCYDNCYDICYTNGG